MARETDAEKVARFETALNQLTERIAEDRYFDFPKFDPSGLGD